MLVRVTLHAAFRQYLPTDAEDNTALLEVSEGAILSDLLAKLSIPKGTEGMFIREGEHLESSSALADGQKLDIFPPIAGGS